MQFIQGRTSGPHLTKSKQISQVSLPQVEIEQLYDVQSQRSQKSQFAQNPIIILNQTSHPNAIESRTSNPPHNSPSQQKGHNNKTFPSNPSTKGSSLQLEQPPIIFYEIAIEIVCLLILSYTWAYYLVEQRKLSQNVPIQYDIDKTVGKINKNQLIVVVLSDTFCYLLISILQLLPHKFKYFIEVTKENCQQVFLITRIYIQYNKLLTIFTFLYVVIALFYVVRQEWEGGLMYLTVIAAIPYTIGGIMYYRKLTQISMDLAA